MLKNKVSNIKLRMLFFNKMAKDNNDSSNYDYGDGSYTAMSEGKKLKTITDAPHKSPGAFFASDNNDIDFPIDMQNEDSSNSGSIIGDSETFEKPDRLGPGVDTKPNDGIFPGSVGFGDIESYPASVPIGGISDKYLPINDFEGKTPDQLDFGRGYTEDYEPNDILNEEDLKELENKYITPAETDLFGLPDGIDPVSDLDADQTINDDTPNYGVTDTGRQMYEDKWNI